MVTISDNTGSGNGLLPDVTNPFHVPMPIYQRHSVAFTCFIHDMCSEITFSKWLPHGIWPNELIIESTSHGSHNIALVYDFVSAIILLCPWEVFSHIRTITGHAHRYVCMRLSYTPVAPFTNMVELWSHRGLVITCPSKCGLKLLIHTPTSTV